MPEHSVFKGLNNENSETRSFIMICLILAFPIYWAAMFYIKAVTGIEEELYASAASIAFFIFFYIGWYIAEVYIGNQEKSINQLLFGLTIIIIPCFIFMFAHADFQLHGQPAINLLLFWIPFIILSITIGMMVKLFRKSIRHKLQKAEAVATQSLTELTLLQSQLSPHFLFNTLNNMYGLSLIEHEKIPKLLLKLSDLLRYSIYEAKELMVPLKSEINYINNYIDFEKIRIGDRLELNCDIEEINTEQVKIAPMLLIVFIENAFKHAKNTAEKKIFVDISLKLWNGIILFSVRNSYDEHILKVPNPNSGLGLLNAKKRLEALYANEHSFTLDEQNNFYSVILQLRAK